MWVLLGQLCSYHYWCYMAIEGFSGGGRRGFVLIPKGKKKLGWCGYVEVMRYLLVPYTPVYQASPAVI